MRVCCFVQVHCCIILALPDTPVHTVRTTELVYLPDSLTVPVESSRERESFYTIERLMDMI